MSITVRMYAARKEWNLESVTIQLRHDRIHVDDCRDCETETGRVDEIHAIVGFAGELDVDQRKRLLEISQKCPVHRTLTSEIKIRTSAARDGS